FDHCFRLPSALDNRPLKFAEFEEKTNQNVYITASPGPYEREHTNEIVEQIIRPTGLLDPEIHVRKIDGQIDDLIHEIHIRTERNERVLVTTLTKSMYEVLTDYFKNLHINDSYLLF